jgi:hypothetical protein
MATGKRSRWKPAPGTRERMRAAAPEMAARWFRGLHAPLGGRAFPGWHNKLCLIRDACLFELLDRATTDSRPRATPAPPRPWSDAWLVARVIDIDSAMMACALDRVPALAAVDAELLAPGQRVPVWVTRRQLAKRVGISPRSIGRLIAKDTITETERGIDLRAAVAHLGPVGELSYLTRQLASAATEREVIEAWWSVSPYTRRQVMLCAPRPVLVQLQVDKAALVEACAVAARKASGRPSEIPVKLAAATIYDVCRALPISWDAGSGVGKGRSTELDGIALAMQIGERYRVPFARRALVGIDAQLRQLGLDPALRAQAVARRG